MEGRLHQTLCEYLREEKPQSLHGYFEMRTLGNSSSHCTREWTFPVAPGSLSPLAAEWTIPSERVPHLSHEFNSSITRIQILDFLNCYNTWSWYFIYIHCRSCSTGQPFEVGAVIIPILWIWELRFRGLAKGHVASIGMKQNWNWRQ